MVNALDSIGIDGDRRRVKLGVMMKLLRTRVIMVGLMKE